MHFLSYSYKRYLTVSIQLPLFIFKMFPPWNFGFSYRYKFCSCTQGILIFENVVLVSWFCFSVFLNRKEERERGCKELTLSSRWGKSSYAFSHYQILIQFDKNLLYKLFQSRRECEWPSSVFSLILHCTSLSQGI